MHRGLALSLAVAGIALAGCSAPAEPQVTFYSHGNAVSVAPSLYCDPRIENCRGPQGNPVRTLRVPTGQPLQISVPREVASTPWQVAFVYRSSTGAEIDGRTSVFAPNQRFAYTLRLPPEAAQLEHVEVQQFSAALMPGNDGGIDFAIGGSWIVNTTP